MKKILIPTNLSSISLNAVNYAADLAVAIGADISLIYVCPIPVSYGDIPIPVYNYDEFIADARELLEQMKDKIAARHKAALKVDVEVKIGELIPAIKAYCDEIQPYAIVMGAESNGTIERFLFGGKTIDSVKYLSWPVIVVPPDIQFSKIRKIGLACDFRDISLIPVDQVIGLISNFNAEFHILHVMPKDSGHNKTAAHELTWLEKKLEVLKPHSHFITGKDEDRLIEDFAAEKKLDILMVIVKDHNVVEGIFHHSHTKRLLLDARVVVMTIHELIS